ncbi:MAG TPA: STAS/SEC14 domain-containing protein [Cytophagales bacterium]|nr:STAS/SEC14 domain-containing protein [Cytophagales bacterium]
MEVLENDYIKLWKEGDIVVGSYKKGAHITLDVAKEVVQMRLEFQKHKKYRLLVFLNEMTGTAEARQYLAVEGFAGVERLALIAQSTVTKVLGNFYILVNKPIVTTKLFSNKVEALRWLQQ